VIAFVLSIKTEVIVAIGIVAGAIAASTIP
jgi:hypothetical protein